MVRRWLPSVGALALLLGSAGTSSAQVVLFVPAGLGNPVFGYGPYNNAGNWGFYPGGYGMGYGPRSYGAFSNFGPVSTGVSTFATNPYYNGYNAALAAQASYFGFGAPPSPSYSMPMTSYVAFSRRGSPGNIATVAYEQPDLTARVDVRVPADAELWFDGHRTSQTGRDRTFHTPPLEKGQGYHYTVRARWVQDGEPVDQTQRVSVSAGSRTTVTFPKPK
jgi:uncharacterized protein (TIGR03000 family)